VIVLLLFLAGMALLFCELFIPGGVLGTVGIICIGGSIVMAFREYPDIAPAVLAVEVLVLAIGVVVGLKIFPHTPIAKRLTLAREFDTKEGFTSASSELEKYLGKEGVAVTTLRPAGMALIEGKRVNVVTDGEYIEKDEPVKVSEVEGQAKARQTCARRTRHSREGWNDALLGCTSCGLAMEGNQALLKSDARPVMTVGSCLGQHDKVGFITSVGSFYEKTT
jgi:membrane protein implicated in regulation of membrane protease activity